ncbi:ABC-type transport system, periplasmic component [Methanocella arvoryzae MRE50]|uniref:ABC-type transport system, periplasmic component n=2 Tax=Methanocella TaxID=570266 RepID=Q0W5Z6_METAR|nr:ABC-type transport system, periplasmic component [Methanocella arvoryzae MRE50]
MKRITIVAILIALIVAMSGCTTPSPGPSAPASPTATPAAGSAFPVTITDAFGKTTTLDKAPERIVSLSAANTEVLFALGLGSKIVGTDDYSEYPPEAKNITHVSGYSGVSYEKIIAVNPDVIFVEDIVGEEAVTSLKDKGFKVIEVKNNNMSAIVETIELMGRATGTESNAAALIDDINARMDAINSKTADLDESQKPTVLLVASYLTGESIYVYGANTYGDDMIRLTGGINAAGDVTEYKVMSTEAIIAADPDFIIIPVDGVMTTQSSFDNFRYGNESWMQGLSAVKNGNVIQADGNVMMRPGPRMPDAALDIARAIHPELFP